MTNFIYNNTGLPINKSNAGPLPPGVNPTQWGVAAEWVTVLQALLDVQGWARGAAWLGVQPHATDPAPAGIADYVWLRNDNTWMHNNTPINGGGGGSGIDVVTTGAPITQPMGVVITPDSAFAYIVNQDVNTVTVVNTATNQPVAIVPVGSSPFNIGMTTNGAFVYVANELDATTSVIRTSDNTVVATIPSAAPYSYVSRPDSAFVYCMNLGGDISVIQVSSQTVVATPNAGGAGVQKIVMRPSGTHIYVANSSTSTVYRIDTTTQAVDATIPGLGALYTISNCTPSGNKLYAADTYQFRVIDLTTNTAGAPIALLFFSSTNDMLCAPDGSHVYATSNAAGRTAVIETTGDTVVADFFVASPIYSNTLVAAPDSAHYYFNGGGGDTYSIETAGYTLAATIVLDGSSPFNTAITPDGTKIYVPLRNQNLVDVIQTSTNTVAPIMPGSTLGPFTSMTFPGATITDLGGGEVSVAIPTPPAVFTAGTGTGSAVQNNGTGNAAAASHSIAMGNGSSCPNSEADGSFASGQSNAGGNFSTSMGGSIANGDFATALGGSQAMGPYSFTAGDGGEATADSSMAIGGYGSIASGPASSGIGGFGQNASGEGATAIGGYGSGAEGIASVALNEALTQGENSLAGNDGWATGYGATSFGGGKAGPGEYAASVNEAFADGDDAWGTGAQGNATRTTQRTHAGGCFQALSNATQMASAQESTLVMRAQTPGAGAGETAELYFSRNPGPGTQLHFSLEDNKCYLIEIAAVVNGLVAAALNVQTFKRRYAVRRTAGLTTIAAVGTLEQLGDAASASWTLTASVLAGPDRFALTLSTGTTTTSARAVAKVSFTEVLLAS